MGRIYPPPDAFHNSEFSVQRVPSSGAKSVAKSEHRDRESSGGELIDKVVKIKRCAAVVKGGRRFSFAAMVVVGNGKGRVGAGYGKANEVPPSVEKAVKAGSQALVDVSLLNGSIPHTVKGTYGAAEVLLVPASPGTGVIAGMAVRAVCEAVGIRDILTKSFGSNNPVALVKATIVALQQLRTRNEVERLRGVSLS
ncbi:MAG: 30S ribosomal protein S5 [Planctomycetia bacterium]|nr:30S ribosomal protein S5 [Planctomycetia bacterium]